MGFWNVGFWENDTALDVKEDFKKYYKFGADDNEAIEYVIKKTIPINDKWDGPIVLMVLAYELWKCGRLTDEWINRAKEAAKKDLENWKTETDKETFMLRKTVLDEFIMTISKPQCCPKVIKRSAIPLAFKNVWKRGDVFAVKNTKKYIMRKDRNTEADYFNGGGIVLLIVAFSDEKDYISLSSKFLPNVNDIKSLTDKQIIDAPLVESNINIFIEYEKQISKYKYIGNLLDAVCLNEASNYNINIDLLPDLTIKDYFCHIKGYKFNVTQISKIPSL